MMSVQTILNVLLKHETALDLFDEKAVEQILKRVVSNDSCLTFFVFSCLASERKNEHLIIDFFKTSFFDGGNKRISTAAKTVIELVKEVESLGIKTSVMPILVDTEPRRTWGWQTDQDELTFACEIMIDQALKSNLLPSNWQPTLWSTLESEFKSLIIEKTLTHEQMMLWARGKGKHVINIDQQENHLRKFSSRYYFPLNLKETAIRQVAAYAYESVVLKALYPNGLLVQTEEPYKEKDVLYNQSIIQDKVIIIHPVGRKKRSLQPTKIIERCYRPSH